MAMGNTGNQENQILGLQVVIPISLIKHLIHKVDVLMLILFFASKIGYENLEI